MTLPYQPHQKIDHYEILSRLPDGQGSQVYRAQDWQHYREVILKVPNIMQRGGHMALRRLDRDIALCQSLQHPAFDQVLDRSENYVVLQAVQGETLRQYIQTSLTSLPEHDILILAIQMCKALAILHERGIVHRDLTPEHIRIRPEHTLQLTDLGRAEEIQRPHIQWRQIGFPEGTPDYLAPELWWGSPGSVRSDIYAMGVILYELACGHTPFRHVEPLSLWIPQLAFDPPDIRHSGGTLSPALATVLMRMIRRDPRKRYATLQDVHADLSHLGQVRVVEYVPDHPLLGGNYRLLLFLALLVLLTLAGLTIFGLLAQWAYTGSW